MESGPGLGAVLNWFRGVYPQQWGSGFREHGAEWPQARDWSARTPHRYRQPICSSWNPSSAAVKKGAAILERIPVSWAGTLRPCRMASPVQARPRVLGGHRRGLTAGRTPSSHGHRGTVTCRHTPPGRPDQPHAPHPLHGANQVDRPADRPPAVTGPFQKALAAGQPFLTQEGPGIAAIHGVIRLEAQQPDPVTDMGRANERTSVRQESPAQPAQQRLAQPPQRPRVDAQHHQVPFRAQHPVHLAQQLDRRAHV